MYVHICICMPVYVHLICMCILLVVCRLGGLSVKRKHLLFFNIASKMPSPRSSRQPLSGGWGQRPLPRPSITRCELGSLCNVKLSRISSLHPGGGSAGLLTESSVSGTSLHKAQAPRVPPTCPGMHHIVLWCCNWVSGASQG